jgi:N-methylhydantoinase A
VEFTRGMIALLDNLDWAAALSLTTELEARGRAVLRDGGIPDADIASELSADMRYAGQGFEITVPIDRELLTRRDVAGLQRAFAAHYRERFARTLERVPVELVALRVRAIAPPAVTEVLLDEVETSGDVLIERRAAWFGEPGAFVDTPVYARARLRAGDEIAGPALIEEAESTAVIGPGATAILDRFGNLIMRL